MKEKPSIYVFDTNIFLTGIDFNVIEAEIYTSPLIIEEVQDRRYVEKNRNAEKLSPRITRINTLFPRI